MPFTCVIPRRFTTCGGKTRLAKARRKISSNCLSMPPMPSFSKDTSLERNRLGATLLRWFTTLMPPPLRAWNTNALFATSILRATRGISAQRWVASQARPAASAPAVRALLLLLSLHQRARHRGQVVVAQVLEGPLRYARAATHLLLEALEQLLHEAGRVHLLLRRAGAARLYKLQLHRQQRQLELLARHFEVVHLQVVARRHACQLRASRVSKRRACGHA